MEENIKMIESLLEKATEYGKTSLELFKLKALDKTTDIVSTLIPQSLVFIAIMSFVLFINIGLALWLGDILGEVFYGFIAVAALYGFSAFVIHFFLHKWIKKYIRNSIIKMVLK